MPYKDYKKTLEANRRSNEKHRDEIHERRRIAQERNKTYVLGYLYQHPCVDCGETDPVVLEFDHVRGEKIRPISHMVSTQAPLATLVQEIGKCEVRCANCHRRKTFKQLGWSKI
jgi:hypothetical protein